MIPPAEITNLSPTAPAAGTAGTPAVASNPAAISTALAQNSQNILTQVAVGRLLQAQVLAQLEDGSYIVGIEDSALRMSLPEGTTVGSKLQMSFVGDSPRPTFLLESQTDTSSAQLSTAAKIISNVLQTADEANAPNALAGKTPILSAPASDPPHIANAMQDSVEFSGLFYESHVSQWASGERPLADLMREPQMQQAPDSGRTARSDLANAGRTQSQPQVQGNALQRPATSEADLAKLIDNARAGADTRTSLGQTLSNLLSNTHGLPQEADTLVKPAGINAQDAQTIHLQLNALEQNRYVWQGELWPGQHMEWEIQEEQGRQGQAAPADADQSSWNSTVRFELPRLGRISATIHLSGGHVQMRVAAVSNETASQLRSHGRELVQALGDAGSPLDSLSIGQDEQA
ncbi:MAG TPA: flagellar hook-length control protein FliK [Burkholderiaceae bacterium]